MFELCEVRRLALLLSLAGACSSSSPKPTSYPTFEDERGAAASAAPTSVSDIHEVSSARAPTMAPAAPAAPAAPPPGLSPALVQAVGARRLYIDELKSLRLFADERLAAQQLIADWAAAAGLSILPPREVEQALALAAAGKHALTGAVCGPALDRDTATERWAPTLGAAGKITAAIQCEDACVLQVAIELTGMGTEFYAAPYDAGQPWREELPRRLAQVVDNGGHDQHGHANNPVAVAGVAPTPAALAQLIPDAADLPVPEKTAAAVARSCGVGLYSVAVLLEGGATPRCERLADPRYVTDVEPARNACVCAALLKEGKPTGRQVARIEGPDPLGPDTSSTKNGLRIYADAVARDDDGRVRWFFPGYAGMASLEHCFVQRTQLLEQVEVKVTLDFDAQGKVRKLVLGDVAGVLKKDERDCVTRTLQTARAPCPERAGLSGVGSVSLAIRQD